jgi:hypothetical protein
LLKKITGWIDLQYKIIITKYLNIAIAREKGGGGNEIHAPSACVNTLVYFYLATYSRQER